MVWRVGTGERVRIKEDRWLPDKTNGLVSSPLSQVAAETKVSSLINQDQVRWNEEVVHNLFLPHEADSILAIPLSFRRPLDRIAWKHTPSGMFTTSGAYKLIVSCDSMPNAGSSSVENQKKFWKSLWQLRVPNKIKHFVWRACNEALPTKTNLHHHHVTDYDICDLRGEHPEDTVHAL
ncbi:hypothetical protein SO802_023203 [Lithocarpus litseifolius]|uniref:Reverse transcriptase zinc-binding domain-containing protein n=1 Tax=Lithocarpus litseifolius TaxID=425828 RepID=A0AAW2C5I4_9ROSI